MNAELLAVLRCPVCGGDVDSRLRCAACGRTYRESEGIAELIADGVDEHKRRQAEWFADADPEWEVERPHGAPRLHLWLLEEKVRRSVSELGDLRGRRVLVSCGGSGMDAEFLARRGAVVVTTDISPAAARRAVERGRRHGVVIDSIVADAERLPFADKSFDVAYVHDGLHHLEDPLVGLREMMRVASRAVAVTEPARAAVTRLAMHAGIATETEDAGNRVERLEPAHVVSVLEAGGFDVVRAGRYGMFYRHEPGLAVRALSRPGLYEASRLALTAANAVAGGLGNKLAVQAVRL